MIGHVDPSSEAFATFRAHERPGPVHMLNLVRLRADAAYPDGRGGSGLQAYRSYATETAPILARIGGHIVWRGAFEQTLIGPTDEQWDHCFVVEYPSVDAFVSMIRDPEYQAAVVHRQAAVADSRLIRLAPRPTASAFAGD